MSLRCVHEKRMAQIHRASLSYGQSLFSLSGTSEIPRDQLAQGQSVLSCWCQLPRHINVRAHADARGCIIGTDIREQKQHQQGASLAAHICAPFHEVRMFVSETDIDVPAIVTGRVLRRKADRKSAKGITGPPAAGSDKLLEGPVQLRCIRRLPERGLAELIQANNRPGPCRTIIRVASGGLPQDRPSLLRGLRAEGAIDADETVAHE